MNKCKLGDIASSQTGPFGSQLHEEDYVKEGIPIVTVEHLGDIGFTTQNLPFVSEQDAERLSKYTLMEGDIVFSRVGAIDRCVFTKKEQEGWLFSGRCIRVRCDSSKVNSRYLSYYFKLPFFKKMMLNLSVGATMPSLNTHLMDNVELNLLDRESQDKIATFLNNIDSKIENNNKIISELESMTKTIYDYWFLQFEFPNEDGKPYKSSGGKMVWNEELKREIPEGWNVTNVGNITACLDSKRVPLSSKDRENMKGPYPYYGATSKMDSVNEYLFDGDYVLLAEDGSVMDDNGFPILQRTSGKVWVNNHAHVLQPKKPYGCKLLMFILKNIPVSMIKTGSIQMKVNQENLNAFKVLSIPENLIEKANSILNPIDAKIIMLKQENQELASLRDFILPMLMNGQVTFKEKD